MACGEGTEKITGLAFLIAVVWFVAAVQHQDNGTVLAVTGSSSGLQPGMREIDTAAGKLILIGPKSDTGPSTTSLGSDMNTARDNFTIEKFGWHKEAFDTVMMADFTFANKNNFDIKDVAISCTDFAESGTVIDTNNRVIYQLFRGASKTYCEL